MCITTQVLGLIRHLYMPKRNLTKYTGWGIINTKCIVISKIQGAQIGWNHRTVYALPSESEEFVSGKSKRRLQGAGMNSSYKGNSISMGILLPFFVTMHSDLPGSEAVPELSGKRQAGQEIAERGIGGI